MYLPRRIEQPPYTEGNSIPSLRVCRTAGVLSLVFETLKVKMLIFMKC